MNKQPMKMNKNTLIMSIILILVVILFAGLIYININLDKTNDYMTASEVFNNLEIDFGEETFNRDINYKSFEEGDKIILRDKIYNITYYDSEDIETGESSHTKVTFFINDEIKFNYFFADDITDSFSINDEVQITYHIIQFNYQIIGLETNGTLYYNREVIEEGFNAEYYKNFRKVLIPKDAIEKV